MEIQKYKYIRTNSLHAYIIANAYKIPVWLLPLHSGIIGGDFKYRDFQSGLIFCEYKQNNELLNKINDTKQPET